MAGMNRDLPTVARWLTALISRVLGAWMRQRGFEKYPIDSRRPARYMERRLRNLVRARLRPGLK
jgi:hypothetical protein